MGKHRVSRQSFRVAVTALPAPRSFPTSDHFVVVMGHHRSERLWNKQAPGDRRDSLSLTGARCRREGGAHVSHSDPAIIGRFGRGSTNRRKSWGHVSHPDRAVVFDRGSGDFDGIDLFHGFLQCLGPTQRRAHKI